MPRTPIVDLHPELIAGIPQERRELARERLLAPVEHLRVGPWAPDARGGGIGVLIVDGLLMRDVVLGETVATTDGTWMLHGDPPEALEYLRDAAAERKRLA